MRHCEVTIPAPQHGRSRTPGTGWLRVRPRSWQIWGTGCLSPPPPHNRFLGTEAPPEQPPRPEPLQGRGESGRVALPGGRRSAGPGHGVAGWPGPGSVSSSCSAGSSSSPLLGAGPSVGRAPAVSAAWPAGRLCVFLAGGGQGWRVPGVRAETGVSRVLGLGPGRCIYGLRSGWPGRGLGLGIGRPPVLSLGAGRRGLGAARAGLGVVPEQNPAASRPPSAPQPGPYTL